MLLLLAGCTLDLYPSESAQKPISAPIWRSVGFVDDSHLSVPALEEGASLLGPACFTINERLTRLDPRRPGDGPPCGAERWTNGEERFDLLWSGQHALLARNGGLDIGAQNVWHALDGTLATCLGGLDGMLLTLPPGGDPGATRGTDGKVWTLQFSGAGRCALTGALKLWMRTDRADPTGLMVEGLPWRKGGSARAEALLMR
jgi:hypothetical protein